MTLWRSSRLQARFVAAAALCAVTVSAFAAQDAQQLLASMNEALAAKTYRGEFLHLAEGRTEKLQIVHRFKDGQIAERLLSLSGSGREVVRNNAEVQCYLPDSRTVVVESRPDQTSLLGNLPVFDDSLQANYQLELGGEVRTLMGGLARVVNVIPRDGFRFGYRLWIDEATHLPVRTDLSSAEGVVLEQVVFTTLRISSSLPDAAFRPTTQASGFQWVRQQAAVTRSGKGASQWRLGELPPGFRLSSWSEQRLAGTDQPVSHLVVSDGLASVSVFIESVPQAPHAPVTGEAKVGSAYAYSRFVAGHQVTALGEVPRETVALIASGVRAARLTRPAATPKEATAQP